MAGGLMGSRMLSQVMNETHSVLMSNSIARTAPARCSSSARVRTDSAGPMA